MEDHFHNPRLRRFVDFVANRRAVLATGAATAASIVVNQSLKAQDASSTPEGSPEPGATPAPPPDPNFGQEYLFVQTFASGHVASSPDKGSMLEITVAGTPTTKPAPDYLLTLNGHIGETIFFSDRPARVFGEAPTGRFLDNLGFSPADPPNAALVTTGDNGEDIAVIVELFDPIYDESSGAVTYNANILSAYDGEGLKHILSRNLSSDLTPDFGAGSLFIDDCPDAGLNCYYFNGLHCKLVATISMGTCWSWYNMSCNACDDPATLCNAQISTCQNSCEGVLASGNQPICFG